MESIMNQEELIKCVDKIKMYKKLEELNFNNIQEELENIILYYNTSYKEKLENVHFELTNKLNNILKLHEDHIDFINNNITIYQNTSMQVAKMFDDINKK